MNKLIILVVLVLVFAGCTLLEIPPQAPNGVTVLETNGELTVSWDEYKEKLDGFEITIYDFLNKVYLPTVEIIGDVTSASVGPLNYGYYLVSVAAFNSNGSSLHSDPIDIWVGDPPDGWTPNS